MLNLKTTSLSPTPYEVGLFFLDLVMDMESKKINIGINKMYFPAHSTS